MEGGYPLALDVPARVQGMAFVVAPARQGAE